MKYPPLSRSLISPPIDNIYIYATYSTQSYEAYKKKGDKYYLIGQLPFSTFVDNFYGQKIYSQWLQDIGYEPKKKYFLDKAKEASEDA